MRTGSIAAAGTALLLAFAATAAQAHDPAAVHAEWLAEKLELTEEQQARVDAILAEAREQREALRAQAREMRKAAAKQRKSLREQSNAVDQSMQDQLAAVLTEEQNARLADMREELDRHAIMRRGAHGARGGMRAPGKERRKGMARHMLRHHKMKEQAKTPASEE